VTDPPEQDAKRWRGQTYPHAPALLVLDQACIVVSRAFDATPYLVGSSLHTREFRDVDVRVMVDDEQYERLFPGCERGVRGSLNPMWSLLCSAISGHLSALTGLPVDFQVQRADDANARFKGPRVPLGIPTFGP
jgi:hypothetical protein